MKNMKKRNVVVGILCGALVAFVFTVLIMPTIFIMVYSFAASQDEDAELVFTESFPIEALKDQQYAFNNIANDKINYLRRTNDKITSESVYTDDASFVESSEKPHVKKYFLLPSKNGDLFLKVGKYLNDGEIPHYFYEKYVFYIPEGSLETEFSVDLE